MNDESLLRVKLLELLKKAEITDESSELVSIQNILNDVFDNIKNEENWGILSLEHKTYSRTIEGMVRALAQQPLEISLNTLFRVMSETIRTTIHPIPPFIQFHSLDLLIPSKTKLDVKKNYEKISDEDYENKALEAILSREISKKKINNQEFQLILSKAREKLLSGIKINELMIDRELLDAISILSGHLSNTEKIVEKNHVLYLVKTNNNKNMKKKTLIIDREESESY